MKRREKKNVPGRAKDDDGTSEADRAQVRDVGTEKKPPAAGTESKRQAGVRTPVSRAAKARDRAEQAVKEDKDLISDRLLRLQADFDNFRKRTLREKNELCRHANEDLMQELLPALDHLNLALTAAKTYSAHEPVVEGFKLVSEQMMSVLGKFGLSPIDAEGVEFDPGRHEAISRMASDAVPENTVITQVRRGYMFGDRLLRPAQVVVSSGTPDHSGSGETAAGGAKAQNGTPDTREAESGERSVEDKRGQEKGEE